MGGKVRDIEVPFEVPESWEWVYIGNIFNLQAGKFIQAQNIYQEFIDNRFPCFGGNGLRGYVDKYNREGAFPLIGRQGALCGNINFANGRFYATEHAIVVEYFANVNVKWICYFLSALNLNQYSTATAQPGLAVSTINNVLLPLPPLAEQFRIVTQIENLLPRIAEYDTTEQKLTTLNATFPERLKKSILQAAVQGKLVPQDPNDEPASELLKRIRAEKQMSKKEKQPLHISQYKNDDEIPFDIPESWEWVRLGDIFNVIMGQSPDSKSVSESNNGIEFHQGKVFFSKYIIKKSNQTTNAPTKIAPASSVLLCVRAPVGKVNITDRELCIGRGLCSIQPLAKISVEFVFRLLEAYELIFVKKSTGTTFVAITSEIVKNQFIPLPPLAEQHRVVKCIEELFTQIDAITK